MFTNKELIVCDDWHTFSGFLNWMSEKCDGDTRLMLFNLYDGKLYSPETTEVITKSEFKRRKVEALRIAQREKTMMMFASKLKEAVKLLADDNYTVKKLCVKINVTPKRFKNLIREHDEIELVDGLLRLKDTQVN